MPFYEYECDGGHRFEQRHSMADRHNVSCPECGKPAQLMMSISSTRIAVPLTVVQDLGRGRGYQVLDHKTDMGVTRKAGVPYKTGKEVQHEEEDSRNEVVRNAVSSGRTN